jgi:hypothetical protein
MALYCSCRMCSRSAPSLCLVRKGGGAIERVNRRQSNVDDLALCLCRCAEWQQSLTIRKHMCALLRVAKRRVRVRSHPLHNPRKSQPAAAATTRAVQSVTPLPRCHRVCDVGLTMCIRGQTMPGPAVPAHKRHYRVRRGDRSLCQDCSYCCGPPTSFGACKELRATTVRRR